jgi:DNA-binding PadR family transcriptional regulator
MSRKVNKYFVTIPVSSWQIAKLLGSETNWKILETLRDVGIEGLSTEEISEKMDVPISSIYSILSKLEAADWIESSKRRLHWGRPSKETKKRFGGKPTRVYTENVPWGRSEFDEDFIQSLDGVLGELKRDVDELREKWLSILDKIASAYQTDDLRKFFPQDALHEECGWSHEGLEFLDASSLALLLKILDDENFDKLGRKYKFKK